jgi:hypothetical protein
MWTRRFFFLLPVLLHAQAPKPQPAKPPKLVLAIVVDQFRYDYLTRFRPDYNGGLARMMEQGAVFTNARFEHVPTVTAVGHSTFLTGATPALSGIIGNEWYDRAAGKRVSSVSDDATKLLGGEGAGSSPRRLLQSTIGDELKLSGKGGKVVGISIKDRSAILPSGHMADGAFWFDSASGNFVSSTFYFAALPPWVAEYNQTRPADRFAGQEWMGTKLPPAPGKALYGALESNPNGNELIQQLALRAISAEKLGSGSKIDLLAVSYSANDYVGHRLGPDAPQVRDMAIRVDKLIGDLIRACETAAGAGNVLVVMTADHGVAPIPEVNQARKMPGGRTKAADLRDTISQALTARYGAAAWITDVTDAGIFLNLNPGKKVDRAEMENIAADAARTVPRVFRVYTRSQLLNGAILEDQVGVRVRNGFNAARSADLIVISDPYWIGEGAPATHGSPFSYDAHVPVMFLGAAIRPGRYHRNVAVNDIAPTLATLLEIETPSGSVGRVLDEAIK